MKKGITILLLATALLGCEEEKKKENEIVFESVVIESEDKCEGLNCPVIDVRYPQIITTSFPTEAINKHIEQAVVAIINSSPKEEVKTMSLEQAISDFKAEFEQMRKDFPDSEAGYEARVKGIVSYQSPKLICLKLDSFMFTGGAHGYTATRYININAQTGEVISNEGLFKNPGRFKETAESAFRVHEKMAETMSLEDAGYWFDDNVYQLPENIGFTKTEVILFYNPYDISSYSEGPIEITIPVEKVKGDLVYL